MDQEGKSGVKAFSTGLGVLAAFIGAEPRLMLKTVAERAGMPPAKAHRYLVSLCSAGFVAQDDATGLYHLSEAALRLGYAAEGSVDVLLLARPVLASLCQRTQQSTMLGMWTSAGPTVALQELVPAPMSFTVTKGSLLPLLRSSTGLAFGAWLPGGQTETILKRELREAKALTDSAPHTAVEAEALFADIRKRAAARVVGQLNAAFSALSVPVFDRDGLVAAVLTLMGPTGAIDVTWSGSSMRLLREAGEELTRRIGGSDPAVGR